MDLVCIGMIKTALCVGVVASIVGVLYFLLDVSVSIEQSRVQLGDTTYNIKTLSSPAVSGQLLALVSYVLSQSIFGTVLRRKLLNGNHVEELRDLGSQINHPPMHFPLLQSPAHHEISPVVFSSHQILHPTHAPHELTYPLTNDFPEVDIQ